MLPSPHCQPGREFTARTKQPDGTKSEEGSSCLSQSRS
ncbi:hypothetical protein LEMLEM_LOCUS11121 [Lemmus lemmus]